MDTAKLYCKELGVKEDLIQSLQDLWWPEIENGPHSILDIIKKHGNDNSKNLFLFAHNPDLKDLINLYIDGEVIENFSTTGISHIEFHIEKWDEISHDEQVGSVRFIESPSSLENALHRVSHSHSHSDLDDKKNVEEKKDKKSSEEDHKKKDKKDDKKHDKKDDKKEEKKDDKKDDKKHDKKDDKKHDKKDDKKDDKKHDKKRRQKRRQKR